MQAYKNNQKGRSIVEMLGVLAIIGVLSVAGIAGYAKAMEKYKLNKLTEQISNLISSIHMAYDTKPSYGDINNDLIISTGMVPEDMAIGTREDIIINAYGGRIYVEPRQNSRGAANGAFRIKMEGLSKKACLAMATTEFEESLIRVEIDDHNITKDSLPVSLKDAAEGCKDCDRTPCFVALTYY
ncbi:MAG: hypothetical protein LBL47_00775 [Lactobacillus sp.]|jgi:type II secretory pathway pseudopilin PulG|nr:hypothetical protein [Lactobacillus sp.]